MKNLIKSLVGFLFFTSGLVYAEPAMNLITVNTKETRAYMEWLKESSEPIAKAIGSYSAGVCRPVAGAEEEGDLYVWWMSDSHQTLASADPQSRAVMKEVAKIDVERTVKTRDTWRVVRSENGVVGDSFATWNLLIKTSNIGEYLGALQNLKNQMNANGFDDVNLNAFLADTGKWAGMIMVSLQASSGGRLGEAMDQRTEPWFVKALSDLEGTREYVHGWMMLCDVNYMQDNS